MSGSNPTSANRRAERKGELGPTRPRCPPGGGDGRVIAFVGAALATVVSSGSSLGCHGGTPDPVLTELSEARSLAAEVRVQFGKAVDASNRAVMADTDDASKAFAREAEQAKQAVQEQSTVAGVRLRHLGLSEELKLLEDFTKRFSEYQTLDGKILALAVENTNLKAQGLLFGPAHKAAEDFATSLAVIARGVVPKNRCRAESQVAAAISDVREVQVLASPHIAEADDAAMTRLEVQMTGLQSSVEGNLRALTKMVPPKARGTLADAVAALDRFKDLSRQITVLSRRNTNVRSLALSLRDRPPLTAACDSSLAALRDALAKEGNTATR